MAFLRFSRDARGYEHFQLVESTTRRGRTRTKVLYWFRTPPGVRVGREPFDEETRRAIEAKNPGVAFDWKRILATPLPSAEAEKWRERRREERAAKRARKAREQANGDTPASEPAEVVDELEAAGEFAAPEGPDASDAPEALEPPRTPEDDV